MKSLVVASLLLCSCLALAVAHQGSKTQASSPMIDAKALWQPGMGIMQDVKDRCSSASDFGGCFVARMREVGASPQAVAFAKLTGNTGFMRDFRDAGRVDVAYVDYPFRANENQGCLLVNGSPAVIDVDDLRLLPNAEMRKDAGYSGLAREYPNLAIFPGDRAGTDYPGVEKLPDGGQRFVVAYRLLNGCHACERVGSVSIAFDFDLAGKFIGRRVVRVVPATAEAARQ